jgi:SNF2 family DNA or RNA helicase
MGLGKTIQLVCFLAGLHCSGLYKPSLVLAPVTTLKHWQRELREWYPPFRTFVLHHTAKSPSGATPHTSSPPGITATQDVADFAHVVGERTASPRESNLESLVHLKQRKLCTMRAGVNG